MVDLISRPSSRQPRFHLTRSLTEELRVGGTEANAETGIRLVEVLLRDAVRERATDIHLDPQEDGWRVRFRIDGALVDSALMTREEGGRLVRQLKVLSNIDLGHSFKPVNARMTHWVEDEEIDLRVAMVPSVFGDKLSVRLLDRRRAGQRLYDLGLADKPRQQIEEWLANIYGMFVVAGPTGSGKTTSLYSLLHELKLQERSVITVEDPVEYRIEGTTQIQVDARHDLTLEQGLRAALRLDPDYVLLGEIRGPEEARAAVEAAGNGRVLMTTIHSPDAVGVVSALRNRGLADHEIASSLQIVVAQRLVRRLCTCCRRPQKLTESDQQWLASLNLPKTIDEAFVGVGCSECRGLGYKGRIGVFEVWRLNDGDYTRILAHADERTLRAAMAAETPNQSLLHDGFEKALQGITSLSELRTISSGYPAPQPEQAKAA